MAGGRSRNGVASLQQPNPTRFQRITPHPPTSCIIRARLTAEVALGQVGIVLGLQVSRLARNNAEWYRLLDLCGLADTLIGDADGIITPPAPRLEGHHERSRTPRPARPARRWHPQQGGL